MVLPTEVLVSINDVIGERDSDEILEKHEFDKGGVTLLWEMFDHLSIEIMDFLRSRFPVLGERNHSIYCELQMIPLREKIEGIERMYECYHSILARYS